MKYIYLITVFTITFTTSTYGQDTAIIYYNSNWNEIENAENASFFRKAFTDSNHLHVAYDYYISGNLQMTGTFKSKKYEKQHGKSTYYYENGQISSEGNYVNGTWDGEWLRYYESGALFEKGTYEEGDMTGVWQIWNEKGLLLVKGTYEKGKKEGVWEIYDDNGSLKERNKFQNDRVTFSEGFHKNGNLSYSGKYSNGEKDGKWMQWNEEGRILSEGYFKKGKRDGIWIRHFKEEKIELTFKNGIFLGVLSGGVVRRE